MLRESGRCGSRDAAPRVRHSVCGCFRPAEEKELAQAAGGHGACSCPGLEGYKEGYEARIELSAHGAAHHSVLLVLVLVALCVGQRHLGLWGKWGGHRCSLPHSCPACVSPAPWRTAGPVPTVWGLLDFPFPWKGRFLSQVVQQWLSSVL